MLSLDQLMELGIFTLIVAVFTGILVAACYFGGSHDGPPDEDGDADASRQSLL